MRFNRSIGEEHKRFDMFRELGLYVNYFMMPYVISLVSDDSYFFFLTFLCEFQQFTNPDETCER